MALSLEIYSNRAKYAFFIFQQFFEINFFLLKQSRVGHGTFWNFSKSNAWLISSSLSGMVPALAGFIVYGQLFNSENPLINPLEQCTVAVLELQLSQVKWTCSNHKQWGLVQFGRNNSCKMNNQMLDIPQKVYLIEATNSHMIASNSLAVLLCMQGELWAIISN